MNNVFTFFSQFLKDIPSIKKLLWSAFIIATISITLIIIFHSSRVFTYPVGWDKSIPITPYNINAKNTSLAHRGNILGIVYEGEKGKTKGIYISLSFDRGSKFLQPILITSILAKIDSNPKISISMSGHIAVVWQGLSEDDLNSGIFYSISKDMGASWSKSKRLKLKSEIELQPHVFYDDREHLHIFYNAFVGNAFNLYHIVSEDGEDYDDPENLIDASTGFRGAFFPTIHIEENNFYIVLQGKEKKADVLSDDLFFISSDNYGGSWSSKKLITDSKAKDSTPYIISYKKDLYLVYQNNEKKNWSIKMARGVDRGSIWEEPITISTTNADCFSPIVVNTKENNIYIVWYDARRKKPSIFARKYSIDKRKLSKEIMLSRSKVSARKPSAFSMDNKVIVIWEETGRVIAKGTDIYVKPPIVFSSTHPKNVWSKSSKATIKWKPPKDESKITGYATFLKKPKDYNLSDLDPTVPNIDSSITQINTPELEDGISYFYIRAIDGAGNYSRTARYKILVSKNPLAMPFIKSSTHPDGKEVESMSPELNWSVEDQTRLKGFLYSLSKGSIKRPKRFTTDFQINFNNLSEGRYFFSIRAVDKTNTPSRIATYQIVVGSAEEIDPKILGKIAKGEIEEKIKPVKIKIPSIPSIDINVPFDNTKIFHKGSFDAAITTRYLKRRNIIGYSYFIGKTEKDLSERVNLKNNIIKVTGLNSGLYYIGAKCRYYKIKKRKKLYLWTDPVFKKFTIEIPEKVSPVVAYVNLIISRIFKSYLVISLSLFTMVLSIAVIGFGTKLTFYAKLFQLRLGSVFKMFL